MHMMLMTPTSHCLAQGFPRARDKMSRRRAELLDAAVWKRQSVSGEFIETIRDKGNARIPADLPATNLFIPSPSKMRSSLSKDAKAAWKKQQTNARPTTADNAINASTSPHIQNESGSTPLLPFVSPFSQVGFARLLIIGYHSNCPAGFS
jgi:hypothetical protein